MSLAAKYPLRSAALIAPAIVAAAAAALFAAASPGCASQASSSLTQSPAPKTRAKPMPRGDARQGYAALLHKTTTEGKALSRAPLPTAVVVFASWCGPCRHELAILGELHKAYPTMRIIGINAYEDYGNRSDQERLKSFVQAYAPWLKQIVHADAALLRSFGQVPKIPTLFVYDAKGKVVAEFRRNQRRPPAREELAAAIASAIAPAATL